MKHALLILLLAASGSAACDQTSAQSAASAQHTVMSSESTQHSARLPQRIPQTKAIEKTLFTISVRYQDVKIGTGAVIELNSLTKFYGVFYTCWRAADGVKVDSTYDRPRPPLRDKDGKKVLDSEGKPKLGDAQPTPFILGVAGTGLGFNQGLAGMHVGGKRRLFIPWQLAYGLKDVSPTGPGFPGVPAKSDLIYDLELVDMTELSPATSKIDN